MDDEKLRQVIMGLEEEWFYTTGSYEQATYITKTLLSELGLWNKGGEDE